MIVIHPEQLRNLVVSAAIIPVRTTAIIMGNDKSEILQKEAYAKYGSIAVKRWHKAGLLNPKRKNRCVYFPVIELVIASQSEIVSNLSPMAMDEIKDYQLYGKL